MRRISISAVKGNERLAKDIYRSNGTILIASGAIIQQEYVPRLKELNIESIYIEDDFSQGIREEEIIEIQIKEQCQNTVRSTLEKYAYCGTAELEKLKCVAEEIIYDILDLPPVMFSIAGVRQRSEEVYSHSLNVCALAVFIALRMKVPKAKINEIAVGSLLHDIGFNYLPTNYLDISYDKLSDKEKNDMKKHVIYGFSAVEKENWLSSVAKDIILSHHERINGTGYPFHLNEEKMKLGSKIVAVCDEFDCLVYGIYKDPIKVHEATEYIVRQGGVLFDLNVVRIFNESVAAYPNGTLVLTNEEEKGIVLRQNQQCPTRPVLRILQDQHNKNYDEWIEKDLTKELTLFIRDTIEII